MKFLNTLCGLTLCLALMTTTGCNSLLPGQDIGSINGHPISKAQFESAYNHGLKMMNLSPELLKGPQAAPLTTMVKKMAIESIIFKTLVEQEAEKKHISVTAEELKQDLDKQVVQMGGEKVLEQQLQALKISKEELMDMLKDQRLKDKLVTSIAGDKLTISQNQVEQFYSTHAKAFDQPEEVRARHILILADAKKMDAATVAKKRDEAQKLFDQVKLDPTQFEALAKAHSEDKGSGAQGGDLGYFAKESMVPEFAQAAFTGKPGEIYPKLVQTTYGFHIIQVVDHKTAAKKSFEQVKGEISHLLENQEKQAIMRKWLDEQRKTAKIELKPEYDFSKAAVLTGPPASEPKAKN